MHRYPSFSRMGMKNLLFFPEHFSRKTCLDESYVLEFCEEFPSQDILWRITISTRAHFLNQWWENSKMNFFWCKVVFSQSGKLWWNYFCRFFCDWEFLGRINFEEFSKIVNFGKKYFSRFSWSGNFGEESLSPQALTVILPQHRIFSYL